FFQAEDGIRDFHVTGVQTCALPICQTLFDKKYLVVGSGVLSNKEALEFLINNIDEVVASPNIFIFYENTLPSEVLDHVSIKANKVVSFDLVKKDKKLEFNIFSLADGLGTKDRRGLWLSFTKARLVRSEE